MNNKRTNETITLGSGNLYIDTFTGTLPEFKDIIKEEKRLGFIKGGAKLTYSGEVYETSDDLGRVSKRKITSEDIKLTSGIMTWNGNTLKYLCSTARVTETEEKRIVKIGGAENDNGEQYVIVFEHEDKADGNVRIMIVGQNTNGFELTFAKDTETVIHAEFTATKGKLDDEGTLVIIEEDLKEKTPTIE